MDLGMGLGPRAYKRRGPTRSFPGVPLAQFDPESMMVKYFIEFSLHKYLNLAPWASRYAWVLQSKLHMVQGERQYCFGQTIYL